MYTVKLLFRINMQSSKGRSRRGALAGQILPGVIESSLALKSQHCRFKSRHCHGTFDQPLDPYLGRSNMNNSGEKSACSDFNANVNPCPLAFCIKVRSIHSWTKLSLFLEQRTPPISSDSSNPNPQAQNIYPAVNRTSWKARRADSLGTLMISYLRMFNSLSPGTPRNCAPRKTPRHILICPPERRQRQTYQLSRRLPSGAPARLPSTTSTLHPISFWNVSSISTHLFPPWRTRWIVPSRMQSLNARYPKSSVCYGLRTKSETTSRSFFNRPCITRRGSPKPTHITRRRTVVPLHPHSPFIPHFLTVGSQSWIGHQMGRWGVGQ